MKQKTKNKKTVSETIKKKPYERLFGNQFARKYEPEDIEKIADELFVWYDGKSEDGKQRVWMKDFCLVKGINQQRLSEFDKQNEYFRYVYSLCKIKQESALFKLGLTVKSSMPIFALKNVAGWKDRTEILEDNPNEDLSFEGW